MPLKKTKESHNDDFDDGSDDIRGSESEYEFEDEADEDWIMEDSDS